MPSRPKLRYGVKRMNTEYEQPSSNYDRAHRRVLIVREIVHCVTIRTIRNTQDRLSCVLTESRGAVDKRRLCVPSTHA